MVEITERPISPENIINRVTNNSVGCVVAYVGLIRGHSHDKRVLSVEYQDSNGNAEQILQHIINQAKIKWSVEDMAISHRIGKLGVGEINLVVVVASAHRSEGFAACKYAVDQFKQRLPTSKTETYQDGSVLISPGPQETMK